MTTVAIIQARMGSSRLPGKVLMPVAGRPLLSYMLERVARARLLDRTVVATSVDPKDDPIAECCEREKTSVFRGSENDVLDRYYRCALALRPDDVVRLTADCPLIDPAVIDHVVERHRAGGCDYTCNTAPPPGTYPDGMNVEVFSFGALERAWREAGKPSEREHVTFYFWKTGLFRTLRVDRQPPVGDFRMTVDYPEDFQVVSAVLEELYARNRNFTFEDILDFLRSRPDIRRLNASVERNAGWKPSLEMDQRQNRT